MKCSRGTKEGLQLQATEAGPCASALLRATGAATTVVEKTVLWRQATIDPSAGSRVLMVCARIGGFRSHHAEQLLIK